MKNIKSIRNKNYIEGERYKQKIIAGINSNSSSKVPEYRYDEEKPNNIRYLDFLPSNSNEYNNSLDDFYNSSSNIVIVKEHHLLNLRTSVFILVIIHIIP